MTYNLSRAPVIDSVLLTSCQSLTPNEAGYTGQTLAFVNQQSDYWNIDDILAEEELVPCRFKADAKNLAFLDMMDARSDQAAKK